MHDPEHDVELVRHLIRSWYSTRSWAEHLLVDGLGLDDARDIMKRGPGRRVGQIPGTPWRFRQHGIGVEVTQRGNRGGIDFDFDRPPDAGWMRDFLVKQYNGGNLVKRLYRPLMQDMARWEAAVAAALRLPHDDG